MMYEHDANQFPTNTKAVLLKPPSSPFDGPVQEVEEGLQDHMVARLVRMMKFGRVQGDRGPRRIPNTLKYTKARVYKSINTLFLNKKNT